MRHQGDTPDLNIVHASVSPSDHPFLPVCLSDVYDGILGWFDAWGFVSDVSRCLPGTFYGVRLRCISDVCVSPVRIANQTRRPSDWLSGLCFNLLPSVCQTLDPNTNPGEMCTFATFCFPDHPRSNRHEIQGASCCATVGLDACRSANSDLDSEPHFSRSLLTRLSALLSTRTMGHDNDGDGDNDDSRCSFRISQAFRGLSYPSTTAIDLGTEPEAAPRGPSPSNILVTVCRVKPSTQQKKSRCKRLPGFPGRADCAPLPEPSQRSRNTGHRPTWLGSVLLLTYIFAQIYDVICITCNIKEIGLRALYIAHPIFHTDDGVCHRYDKQPVSGRPRMWNFGIRGVHELTLLPLELRNIGRHCWTLLGHHLYSIYFPAREGTRADLSTMAMIQPSQNVPD